jgi:hypothetical protein
LLDPDCGDTSTVLRETSNIQGKENQYPNKEELYQLTRIRFNHNFVYIFIDKAGAVTQPETYHRFRHGLSPADRGKRDEGR